MIAKMLSGMQWCCCNFPPTYIGEKKEWYAVCLRCKKSKVGPAPSATAAKKMWNAEFKLRHKTQLAAGQGDGGKNG